MQSSAAQKAAAKKGKEKDKGKDAASVAPAMTQIRVCKLDVFYNWVPEKALGVADKDTSYRRYYGTIMDEGVEEDEVRHRLSGRVSAVSLEAMTECNQVHQEKSSCLVSRLREISKRFARYDYPRRKMLIDSAERDCFTGAGECVSVAVGEVECWGNASPDSPSMADFAPVTVATPVEEDLGGDSVETQEAESKSSKKAEVIEIKRKQVLKATAPAVKAPEPAKAAPVEDSGYNAPFVVE